jgi:hypothetical protein
MSFLDGITPDVCEVWVSSRFPSFDHNGFIAHVIPSESGGLLLAPRVSRLSKYIILLGACAYQYAREPLTQSLVPVVDLDSTTKERELDELAKLFQR